MTMSAINDSTVVRHPALQVVPTRKDPARSAVTAGHQSSGTVRTTAFLAEMPPRLTELLQAGTVERQSRFQDDRFDGMRERWTPPACLTMADGVMARDAIALLDHSVLAAADPAHVLGRILALLSHFPARAQTAEVEQMIALDWAEDLGEFPAWAIDQAARQWRRSQKWRPSIAEMRSLCEEIVAPERALRERLVTLASKAASVEGGSRLADLRRLTGGAIQRMSAVS